MKNILINTVSKLFMLALAALIFSCSDDPVPDEIIADTIPIASFSSLVNVDDWQTYAFTNNSTNGTTYSWSFGDSTSSTDAAPTHTFATSGTYTVILTVTDATGDTDTLESTIVVSNPNSAEAAFTVVADTSNWQVYTFDNTSSNGASYAWNFGDSSTSTDFEPSHTFAVPGTYTVTLTVSGDSGDPSIISETIVVVDPNAPVAPTFEVQVLNSTGNDWTTNTGDNADAWDMSPKLYYS